MTEMFVIITHTQNNKNYVKTYLSHVILYN